MEYYPNDYTHFLNHWAKQCLNHEEIFDSYTMDQKWGEPCSSEIFALFMKKANGTDFTRIGPMAYNLLNL